MRARTKVSEGGKVYRQRILKRGRCGCPKQAYATKKLAKERAVFETKATGETIEAYHCQQGHCWHIGHPPGYGRARAQAQAAAA